MKTSSILLAALLGTAITAQAQGPVYSVNIVGIQKVDVSPTSLEMIANPFVKADSSVQSILGTGFDAGLSPDEADKIYIFDSAANGYKLYYLYNNPGNPNDPRNNKWLDENNQVATEQLTPGKGFFLQNTLGVATNTLSMVGDVVTTPSVTTQIVPGLNQISYPYSTSIAINDLALKTANGVVSAFSPDDGDNIYLWSQQMNTYIRYFLYNNPGNASDPRNNKWLDENNQIATNSIEPGQSFFYQRFTSAPTLNWTETKPY
ncbi:MAG: hypothetical protein U1F77_16050 [Kiritimatiellia bacterium]